MSLSSSNNKVMDRQKSHFLINVCKPVLYGYDAMCPPGSNICFVDSTATDVKQKYRNFGTALGSPTFEGDNVIMRFKSDERCNATHNISSTIIFNCDPNVKVEEPEFIMKDGCEYKFAWYTSLICEEIDSCVAVDPHTGHKYDLSSLSGITYNVTQQNSTYSFAICDTPKEQCIGDAGSCRTHGGSVASLGITSKHLYFNETGSPYLIYESGSACKSLDEKWSTKIEFICASEGTIGPKVIENTGCMLIIQFVTSLACPENQISCEATNSDNTKISLGPLKSATHNYRALINDTLKATEGAPIEYYINVCRPLVPQYGLSCPGGSAACRAIRGNSTPEQEIGLGFPDVSLTIVDKPEGQRAQLKYLRGNTCSKDTSTAITSTIEFYCTPKAGQGLPILQEIIDHCHYFFTWSTNAICPSKDAEFKSKSCEIYNEDTALNYNLRNVAKNGIITVNLSLFFFA